MLAVIHQILNHHRSLEHRWHTKKIKLHQRLALRLFQEDVKQVSTQGFLFSKCLIRPILGSKKTANHQVFAFLLFLLVLSSLLFNSSCKKKNREKIKQMAVLKLHFIIQSYFSSFIINCVVNKITNTVESPESSS